MLKRIEEEHFVPEVIATSQPVLIASLGESAYHRKQMILLAKLSSVLGDRFKLLLMKADKEGLLRRKYGIKTSPAFLLFSQGRIKSRHVGGFTYKQLKGFVFKGLNKASCIEGPRRLAPRLKAVDSSMFDNDYVSEGEERESAYAEL